MKDIYVFLAFKRYVLNTIMFDKICFYYSLSYFLRFIHVVRNFLTSQSVSSIIDVCFVTIYANVLASMGQA